MEKETTQVSKAQKFTTNPFLGNNGYLEIDRGTKKSIIGGTNKILVDSKTGETEGVAILHRFTEVDKTTFVKLFVNEISALFGLTRTGLKTFGFILTCLKPNDDSIYIYIPDLLEYAEWGSLKQAYRGLGELIKNKIIAPSVKPNVWFVNPKVVFNGDRIAFIKEYRLKQDPPEVKQLKAFS